MWPGAKITITRTNAHVKKINLGEMRGGGKSTQNLCKTDSDLKTRSYVKDGIFATSRYIILAAKCLRMLTKPKEENQMQEKKRKSCIKIVVLEFRI